MAPFSFFNFLKNVNANLSPLQLNDLYVDYIKQWSLKKNNTLEESNNVIQERYLSLLKDITLKYSTLDEKRFLSNIDFNDPCDLDIIIPFYSKKIREVCDFYSQKREKLKFKIEKNKIKGIPTSLEKSVYETITDVIFSDVLEVGTYQKLVDEKELLRDLNIEVEELYDLYTSYLDNNPNESYTTYDVKTELRKRLFSANLNAIDADIFINFDQAITNQLFENVRVFLTELGRIFTINYDLNSVNLNCKPDEKLYDLVSNNKPKAERLVTLKGDLIKKYIGCDFYYITTGSTITDVTSSILFKADNPSGNLLNRHFPTTATIEEESDLQSCRRIGLFFTPEKNSILYYSVPDKKYKIDESKLEANKLYIFPDPDRYGNTIGLSRVFDTEYPLIHIADYTRSVKNESCVSVEGDINSNPFSQDFYAYFSKNQLHNNLTTNEEGLKTNFSKLYDLGVLVKWGTDIYGNQYGLFKNKSKKNLVDKTLNVSLSVDICEDYDGGPISFFQNGPLPEAVLLGDPKWVHPNVYNSEYYYNIGIEGSVGKTVNEIITEVVIPSNWHVDTSTTDKGGTIHGTVSLADEGGGVLAANFTNSSYISYDAMSLGTSDFTIEAWTKLDGNEGPGRIFVFSTINVISLCLNQAHSVFSMNNYSFESIIGVYDGNPQSANVLRSLSNVNTIKNKWTHLAMTRVGNTLRMFINGVLQSNATLTLPDNTDYTFGRVDVGYLNGKLTGFRIVKDAVLYTSDFDVPTTLPTDIAGTELLLNFQATVAPTGDPIENEPEANTIIIANNLQDLFVVENYEGIMERGLNRNKSTFIPDFNNNYILSSLKYKDFDAGLITDTCDETFDFDTQTKFILNERLTTSFTVTSNKVEDDNQNFYDLNKSYGTMYVKDVVSGEVSTLLNSLSVQFQSKYEDDFSEILDFNIFNDFIWIRTKNNLILEKIQYDENKFVYSGTSNTSFNTGYIDGFIYNISNPFIFENRDYCMVASLSVTNSESNNFYIIPTIYKIDYNTCNKTKITSILELSSYQNDSNYNDIKLFRINQPILTYNSRNNLYCILATVEDENEFSYIYQIKFTYDGSKISNQEIKFYNFSGTEVFKTINFADKPGFSDNAILINDINSNAFKNFNNGILTFT